MKSVKKTDSLGRRIKRIFSQEDKQKFYVEWKASGLNKSRFCKEKGLTTTAFLLWCKKFADNDSKPSVKKAWIPMVSKNTDTDKDTISVDIRFPNGMSFTTSLDLPRFLSMLKELSHAVTAIR
jgi:hypothetical protein